MEAWRLILMIIFIGVIIYYIVWNHKKLEQTKFVANVLVVFNIDVNVPNVLENKHLLQYGEWQQKSKRTFQVYSLINHERLREEIMKEFNLLKEDVSVYDPAASHTATRF